MPHSSDDTSRRLKSVRLNDDQVELLLDRLDSDSAHPKSMRRSHERYSYRVKACKVRLQQPGAVGAQQFVVPTRDLSAGGMSFLHGSFVHLGTSVFVQLFTQHGNWSDIQGNVVRCEYLEGGAHEVCVKFEHDIQPSDFCAEAVTFRVLVAEDDDAIARLALHHLTKLNAIAERALNGADAVEKARSDVWDCIFMDMEMPVLDGFSATRKLRDEGYTGRIVAMTALTKPEDHERCLTAGCNQYVPKPVTPEKYRQVLDACRAEPLVSAYQDDPEMRELIVQFVSDLPAQIRKLEELLRADNLAGLEGELRCLKGAAGGYGFEPISTAAQAAESAVQRGTDASAARAPVDEVIGLCMLARAPGITGRKEGA